MEITTDFLNIIEILVEWLSIYLIPILISTLAIIIGYILYFLVKKQILNLAKHEKLEKSTAMNITRVVKYLIYLIILFMLLGKFTLFLLNDNTE